MTESTKKGEVYKVVLRREQEQVVEIEIETDGESIEDVAWELAAEEDWQLLDDEVVTIEQITCGGEV